MIAISTAYKEALIAIKHDDKENYKALDSNCKHAENILYNWDEMLDEINFDIKDNDVFSVVVGPGSFTGIRIGIALIKGFYSAHKTKLIGLTTFDLLAYCYLKYNKPKNDFYCVINALSGLYYVCKFDQEGKKISQEMVINQEEYDKLECDKVGLEEEAIGDINVRPHPQDLLELSESFKDKGEFIEESKLIPLYLRKSQAEASLENKKY